MRASLAADWRNITAKGKAGPLLATVIGQRSRWGVILVRAQWVSAVRVDQSPARFLREDPARYSTHTVPEHGYFVHQRPCSVAGPRRGCARPRVFDHGRHDNRRFSA